MERIFSKDQFSYTPSGVCSRQMNFEVENGKIVSLNVVGGCNGNLKGIARLVEGMDVHEVIRRLEGTECGSKNTSCRVQIAKALKEKYGD